MPISSTLGPLAPSEQCATADSRQTIVGATAFEFLPSDHALAREHSVLPIAALGQVPLVLWPREASPLSHDEIMALCRRAGVTPPVAAEGRTVQTLLPLAAVGLGAAGPRRLAKASHPARSPTP